MNYSAYEQCILPDCPCDHRMRVWRIEHVRLPDAYRMLARASGYQSFIVRDDGSRIPV